MTAEVRPQGQPSLARGRILLIGLGPQVVPIIGFSNDYYGCIRFDSEQNIGGPNSDWPTLFYSLGFAGAPRDPYALEAALVGKWSSYGSGVLTNEIYGANKRYAGSFTWQQEWDTSPNEITGEGSWVVDTDTLARFPDNDAPEANYFRIVARYNPPHKVPAGHTNPNAELHQMRADTIGPYELRLTRVNE